MRSGGVGGAVSGAGVACCVPAPVLTAFCAAVTRTGPVDDLTAPQEPVDGWDEPRLAVLGARVAISTAPEEKIDLSYSKARILRALGERAAALEVLREVLAADASHAGALSLAAEIHASEHAWQEAVAALGDEDFQWASIALVDQWRPWLEQQLGGLGLDVVRPSAANFVLVGFPKTPGRTAVEAEAYLAAKGL